MIDLSPLDVRKKKEDFQRALRGYDADQVDAFLDLVSERLEELEDERRSLAQRVETLDEQLEDYRERERALNEALLTAQELREEARQQAERDAELRLKEAEAKAEDILRDARRGADEARDELRELRRRKQGLVHALRGTLKRFADELEVEESRLADREEARGGDASGQEATGEGDRDR
ncbi:MAG TPA: DivIVA domain-containing protein [Longimicrobiales bacterium]|nr:DivIVA domain-containing protein [Longimicrobiales bacterium]